MTSVESNKNFEVIDNEVNTSNTVEYREKDGEVLTTLQTLDASTTYDIDIASKGDKYFFMVNNNFLPIDVTKDTVEKLGGKLVELLNQKDPLYLVGDLYNRGIGKDRTLGYSVILDGKENNLSKYQVEKIFKFLSYVKGEAITAENLHPDICSGNKVTDSCVDAYQLD